jgi:predicted dehydrogenase
MHAAVAVSAMLLGKHVYVQKPLAQTVHEVRTMHDVARRNRLITQMGNQFHSSAGYRCLAQVMSEKPLGKIREVHAWTSSPSWPQGIDRPAGEDAVPEGVHWDLWIGVDEPRPYKQHAYHNFNWRGWQAFGTGALGDMGCHVMDPVTWSLGLTLPVSIAAEAPPHNGETYAKWSIVRYEFPATPLTVGPTVPVTWYDGGKKPDAKLAQGPDGYRLPSNGCLFIGEQGTAVITHSPTVPRLFPEEKFRDYSQQRIREIYKGVSSDDHYRNWTDSVIAGKPANSNFDVAAPLAEMVLLGTIAQRLPGQTLRYDAAKMRFEGNQAADAMLRRKYRAGFAPPELSGS